MKKIRIDPITLGGGGLSDNGKGYCFYDKDSQIHELIDLYLNVFDHPCVDLAPVYGMHQAHENIATHLRARPHIREKVHLISKVGVGWHENGRINMSNDPDLCEQQLYDTLEALGVDQLDTLMIHWPDKKHDIRSLTERLLRLKEKNLFRFFGLSNPDLDDIDKVLELTSIDMIEDELSLMKNSTKWKKLRSHQGLTDSVFIGYGLLSKGVVTKDVSSERKFHSKDVRSHAQWWKKSSWKEQVQEVQNHDLSSDDWFLLSLYHGFHYSDSCCLGMRHTHHLKETLNYLKIFFDHPLEHWEKRYKDVFRF